MIKFIYERYENSVIYGDVIAMKISTKGRYALRMMLDIAENGKEGNVTIKDIAARQNISFKYLEQIVTALNKRGYLRSTRGAQGGYRLVKPAKEYTVGDILRVTEGNMAPVACLEDEINQCERKDICNTLWIWEGLYKSVNEYLDSITIADILEKKSGVKK